MKKFSILLMVVLFAMACEKEQQASVNEMMLKKKPTTGNSNNGGGGNGGGNAFWIVPDQPSITIQVGQTIQLSVAPIAYEWPQVEYYTNDHNVAQSYWNGTVTGISPGVTVISAFHYRQQGQPLQDNIIVYVE